MDLFSKWQTIRPAFRNWAHSAALSSGRANPCPMLYVCLTIYNDVTHSGWVEKWRDFCRTSVSCQSTGGFAPVLLPIASSATGQGGSGACGVPAAPPGLLGQFPDAITFSYQMPGLAGTCTPDITVKEEDRPNALYRIWEYYPCTGQVKEIITDPLPGDEPLDAALGDLCGGSWVQQYYPSAITTMGPGDLRATVAPPSSSAAGQGSQQIVIADLNGDGNPDAALLTSRGITIQLLASDGSVISSTNYPSDSPLPTSSGAISSLRISMATETSTWQSVILATRA